jgi:hypothetical protein
MRWLTAEGMTSIRSAEASKLTTSITAAMRPAPVEAD